MAAAYRVIVSRRAFEDLNAILDFVQKDSPQNAAKMVGLLWDAAISLCDFPYRHRMFKVATRTRPETRVMPVESYLIYYRVIERQKFVRILTVRHGARRQPRGFD